ncbi:MAG: MqnA/MqnD/SBP family protein [Planctomycetota bacterium]
MKVRTERREPVNARPPTGPRLDRWRPRVAVPPVLQVLPLIDGLVRDERLTLLRDAPGRMAVKFATGRLDAALLPTIALQQMDPPPLVLTASCIASHGPTDIVRLVSRVAPATVRLVGIDPDSRVHVGIAAILWAESFGRLPQLRTIDTADDLRGRRRPHAVFYAGDRATLLLGAEYAWQVNLGKAWRELTEVPFVYAVWAVRQDPAVSPAMNRARAAALGEAIAAARRRGMARAEEIAAVLAPRFGWDVPAAVRSLTERTQYKFTLDHRRGLETFFKLAHRHALLPDVRPVAYVDDD